MTLWSRTRPIVRLASASSVCERCLFRLYRCDLSSSSTVDRRAFSKSSRTSIVEAIGARARGQAIDEYFLANGSLSVSRDALRSKSAGASPSATQASSRSAVQVGSSTAQGTELPALEDTADLPHRRRRRLRREGHERSSAGASAAEEPSIPLDASARLSSLSAKLPDRSFRRLFMTYLSLSKPRLSFLILLTTTTAYSLFPVPAMLLPATTAAPSLSTLTLLFLTTGTALSTASANALNMLFEPAYDAKMSRTRNRPLVRRLISPRGALIFAVATGAVGLGALYYGVNPTVAFLSGLNIFLYAGVYTPMKRVSAVNTWVGAVVGGIPPLMGWVAAAGQSASADGGWQELLLSESSVGGWLLAALLFAWQFPHFNSLSWVIREEYRNAGHQMLCWINPRRNGRVALRYSVLCFPLCIGLWYVGVTDVGFVVSSSIANAWLVRKAWLFWRLEGQAGSARGLFWASVWHLPVVMVLAMAQKQGLWAGLWRWMNGEPEEAELDDELEPESESVLQGNAVAAVPVA